MVAWLCGSVDGLIDACKALTGAVNGLTVSVNGLTVSVNGLTGTVPWSGKVNAILGSSGEVTGLTDSGASKSISILDSFSLSLLSDTFLYSW